MERTAKDNETVAGCFIYTIEMLYNATLANPSSSSEGDVGYIAAITVLLLILVFLICVILTLTFKYVLPIWNSKKSLASIPHSKCENFIGSCETV